MAQSKDSVKTEQHAIFPVADNNSEVVLVNGDSVCTVYATDDFNLGNSKKEFRKKEYMVIGKQHFFVMNKFPFFVSRKFHRGKMRYRSAF